VINIDKYIINRQMITNVDNKEQGVAVPDVGVDVGEAVGMAEVGTTSKATDTDKRQRNYMRGNTP